MDSHNFLILLPQVGELAGALLEADLISREERNGSIEACRSTTDLQIYQEGVAHLAQRWEEGRQAGRVA